MDKNNPAKKQAKLNRIKSSVISRSLSLAKITLQTGASIVQHSVTSAVKTKESKEESWKRLLQNQASFISAELGELKGSLMKAGQMLSMYGEHFLPPEANQLLKSLQSNSVPMSWEAIEPTLKKSLPAEKLELLEIDHEALASASMGQVHRARIKSTGENIVLKIQYPDVDKAIDSDLLGLRTILGTLKLLPKDTNFDPIFSEIREMLMQETDYIMEAKLTEKFYELLKNDSRYIIPKVFAEFSGPKILATSYESGVAVDDPLIQSLPQSRRNKIALSFLDLYFREIFEWGIVQTDPHSGNYRIRLDAHGNDQLILFDFGATRSYADNFILPYRRMIKGSLLNDRNVFLKAVLDLGFIHKNDPPELKKLFEEFCLEMVEPFIAHDDPRNIDGRVSADGSYDWKNTDLPQRLSKKIFQIIRSHKWRTPPREILFLDRKTGGVFIFLSILRAKVCGRNVLLKYIETVPD
ncbi:MAG: ABC1 kinase family protein [Pseudobdellovibrionaceae bacterium]